MRIPSILALAAFVVGGVAVTGQLQRRSAVRTPFRPRDLARLNEALDALGVSRFAVSAACRAELMQRITTGAKAVAMEEGTDWRRVVVRLGVQSARIVADMLESPERAYDRPWPNQIRAVLLAHGALEAQKM